MASNKQNLDKDALVYLIEQIINGDEAVEVQLDGKADTDLNNVDVQKIKKLIADNIDADTIATKILESEEFELGVGAIARVEIGEADINAAHINNINGQPIQDGTILAKALSGAMIETIAGSKVYYQATAPAGADFKVDDTWYKTIIDPSDADQYVLHVWDGAQWVGTEFDGKVIRENTITAQQINTNNLATNNAFVGKLETQLESIGDPNGRHVVIDEDSVDIMDGDVQRATFGQVTKLLGENLIIEPYYSPETGYSDFGGTMKMIGEQYDYRVSNGTFKAQVSTRNDGFSHSSEFKVTNPLSPDPLNEDYALRQRGRVGFTGFIADNFYDYNKMGTPHRMIPGKSEDTHLIGSITTGASHFPPDYYDEYWRESNRAYRFAVGATQNAVETKTSNHKLLILQRGTESNEDFYVDDFVPQVEFSVDVDGNIRTNGGLIIGQFTGVHNAEISSDGKVTAASFRVDGHGSDIGYTTTNNGSKSMASSSSFSDISGNISLGAGVWKLTASVRFTNLSSKYYGAQFSADWTKSGTFETLPESFMDGSGASGQASVNISTTVACNTDFNIKIRGCQASGSTRTVNYYWKATRIA